MWEPFSVVQFAHLGLITQNILINHRGLEEELQYRVRSREICCVINLKNIIICPQLQMVQISLHVLC